MQARSEEVQLEATVSPADWSKAFTNTRQRGSVSVQIRSEIKSYVWLKQAHAQILHEA